MFLLWDARNAEVPAVAIRQLVCRMPSCATVGDDPGSDAAVERAARPLRRTAHESEQRVAVHPLEDKISDAPILSDVEQVANIRMVCSDRDACLVEEHLLEIVIAQMR
jgi:hypothetical protein